MCVSVSPCEPEGVCACVHETVCMCVGAPLCVPSQMGYSGGVALSLGVPSANYPPRLHSLTCTGTGTCVELACSCACEGARVILCLDVRTRVCLFVPQRVSVCHCVSVCMCVLPPPQQRPAFSHAAARRGTRPPLVPLAQWRRCSADSRQAFA